MYLISYNNINKPKKTKEKKNWKFFFWRVALPNEVFKFFLSVQWQLTAADSQR